jgi:hypothetical protein
MIIKYASFYLDLNRYVHVVALFPCPSLFEKQYKKQNKLVVVQTG